MLKKRLRTGRRPAARSASKRCWCWPCCSWRVVAGVVFITQGQRRIPTQSAKHVRGRRVYGGTRQYLPLRVNQAGVMPIIFASSLLLFPHDDLPVLGATLSRTRFWTDAGKTRSTAATSFTYNMLYIVLIYFFCYFWTAITFNPEGHGRQPEELRHVHPRLSAGPAHGRLPGKGHGADHLRRGRLPGGGGHHADARFRLDGRRLQRWPASTAAPAC